MIIDEFETEVMHILEETKCYPQVLKILAMLILCHVVIFFDTMETVTLRKQGVDSDRHSRLIVFVCMKLVPMLVQYANE